MIRRLCLPFCCAAGLFPLLLAETAPGQAPPSQAIRSRMSTLENGVLRVGVDLNRGGAITYLAERGGPNVVNSWDLGREIQPSFSSGPHPFGKPRPESPN